jgi:hypothetical protein
MYKHMFPKSITASFVDKDADVDHRELLEQRRLCRSAPPEEQSFKVALHAFFLFSL